MRQQDVELDPELAVYVRARYPALLHFATALTGDPHLAGDLVQDALERTGLAWARVEDPDAYVRRAIANGFTSTWRKRRRERLVDAPPEQPTDDPASHSEDVVWHALEHLPRRQRAVLVLRYYEDLSEADIARVLGVAAGTVKSQSAKGLATLRTVLGEQEQADRSSRG